MPSSSLVEVEVGVEVGIGGFGVGVGFTFRSFLTFSVGLVGGWGGVGWLVRDKAISTQVVVEVEVGVKLDN